MANELYKFDMSGLDNVWLVNGFTWHDTPYGKAIQIEDGEALTRAIAHAVLHKPANITGKEIRFLRTHFEMSQPDLAKLLSKDTQTIARWEKSGKTAKTTEMLARVVFANLLDGNQTISSVVQTLNAIDHAKNARIVAVEKHGEWTAKHEVMV